jgi:hypothetical protein
MAHRSLFSAETGTTRRQFFLSISSSFFFAYRHPIYCWTQPSPLTFPSTTDPASPQSRSTLLHLLLDLETPLLGLSHPIPLHHPSPPHHPIPSQVILTNPVLLIPLTPHLI